MKTVLVIGLSAWFSLSVAEVGFAFDEQATSQLEINVVSCQLDDMKAGNGIEFTKVELFLDLFAALDAKPSDQISGHVLLSSTLHGEENLKVLLSSKSTGFGKSDKPTLLETNFSTKSFAGEAADMNYVLAFQISENSAKDFKGTLKLSGTSRKDYKFPVTCVQLQK